MSAKFEVGDRVIYTRDKYSTRPGPRAKNVFATPHGENYSYQVDKYWIVTEIQPDGSLLLRTRRGKRHLVASGDPRLRRATWLERLYYGRRFPSVSAMDAAESEDKARDKQAVSSSQTYSENA